DARAFAGIKVAAVGEQTAAALGDYGIKPDLVPEAEQSSEGLAAAWPPYDDVLDPINRVLLPRADIATETLVARLTDLGWETEDVTAYRTVRAAPPPAAIREAIKGGGFDAVLFTSSSTVRNLIGIAGKPHAVTAVAAIGPQTAQTAAEYGLRVDVTASRPSATALVDALAEHGARLRDAALAAGEPGRRPPHTVSRERPRSGCAEDDALKEAVVAGRFPEVRPRRLRRTAALRRLVARTSVRGADLVLPLFVKEGIPEPVPVASMPGVVQHTRDSLRKAAADAAEAGGGAPILLATPAPKYHPASH